MRGLIKVSLVILLFFSNYALAQITSSSWLNPKPAGARYLDIELTSVTNAVAVGNEGEIVISTNSGSSWQSVESGTDSYLSSVFFYDQNRGFTLGENGTILKTNDGGFTWSPQNSPTLTDFSSSYFIDINTGYAVGYGTILKYDGNSWSEIDHQYTDAYFEDVRFVSYQVGFICGLRNSEALLLKTTDSGNTWTEVEIPTISGNLISMDFNTEQRGWLIARTGELLRTTDGGANWSVSFVTSNFIQKIEFKTSDSGIIVGEKGTILVSADSGKTWTNKHPIGILEPDYNSFDSNGTYIIAVGNNGVINRSLNGGNSWSRKDENLLINKIENIQYLSSTLGFVETSENQFSGIGLFKTTDGGLSWNPSETGISDPINGVQFLSQTLGYAITDNKFYESNDAGDSWTELHDFGLINDVSDLHFIDKNLGWVLGENEVFKTTDGGSSWNEYQIPAYNYGVSDIYFLNETRGFVAQPDGRLLKSFDGGVSWTSEALNISETLNKIDFSDNSNGWVVGNRGTVLKTTNGGADWFEVDLDKTDDLATIKFKNNLLGYIGGSDGLLLYTVDGGNHWFNENSKFRNQDITAIEFVEPNTMLLGGRYGYLLKNTIIDEGLSLQLLTPTAGETLTIDEKYDITWNSQNVDYIKISYSTNGGLNWRNVEYEYPASTGSYEWSVPLPRRSEVQLRISASDNESVSSLSSTFSIDEPPLSWSKLNSHGNYSLKDIAFINNEGWLLSHDRIYHSTDDGDTWDEIYNNNSFSYNSFMMNNDGTGIIAADDGKVLRTTDSGFNWFASSTQVNEDLTVIDQNGNGVFIGGKNGTLIMSSDGGENWMEVYLDEPFDIGEIEFPSYSDGYIFFNYPNNELGEKFFYKTNDGGYSWQKISLGYDFILGNTISFVSNDVGYAATNYQIIKTTDGGETWRTLLQDNFYIEDLKFSDENFGWASVFVRNSRNGLTYNEAITIQTSDGGETWSYRTNGIYDNAITRIFSINNFTTYAMTKWDVIKYTGDNTPTIDVTTPNGFEFWTSGTEQNITWTYSNVTNVKIDYSIDDGNNWVNIVSSVSAGSGYQWGIPFTPSTDCLIRVSSVENPFSYDISDNNFTIHDPTISLDLTSPDGGETLTYEDTFPIAWNASNIYEVKIEYSIDSGATWSQIIDAFPASVEEFNWQVPNTPSEKCLIQISDTNNKDTSDISNSVFTINSSVQSLTLITPNGGDTLGVGSKYNITWSNGGETAVSNNGGKRKVIDKSAVSKNNEAQVTDNVYIEYTVDDGDSWIPLAGPIDAALKSYEWLVPNIVSNLCKIKVYDAEDNSNRDISDAVFTISDDTTLTNLFLSVNDVIGIPTDTVSIDFDLQINDSVTYSSGLVHVNGFGTKLEFLGADLSGGILEQFNSNFVINDQDSVVKISFASAADIDLSGKLFSLNFLVADSNSSSVPVFIDSVLFDTGIYSVGISHGSVEILQPFYGDVDLNNIVQPYDATIILKNLIGSYPPFNLQQQLNAEVTLDGTISAMDASAILQFTAELINSLPHEFNNNETSPVEFPDIVSGSESIFSVPVLLQNSTNIYSFEGSIRYDNGKLNFEDLILDDSLEGFIKQDTSESGLIKFAAASSSAIEFDGTMMNFEFSKLDSGSISNTKIIFEKMRINESSLSTEFDSCTVDFTTSIEDSRIPKKFTLTQNYPNPFNPTTQIEFGLPQAGYVELKVYNLLGQQVATLVDKKLQPGTHKVEFAASQLASGVYIYRIDVGEKFTSIKKMLLIK